MNVISRRDFICQTALATAAFLPSQVAAQSADAWPQFRGNPMLTGISPTTITPQLKQMWAVSCGDIIESSAAIVDATVYIGAGLPNAKLLVEAKYDNKIICESLVDFYQRLIIQ